MICLEVSFMSSLTSAKVGQASAGVTLAKLWAFFLPLGLSASLVTISHVIINSTLARSHSPELIISSYAIAMSLMGIIEKPAILLRQTCSALVRDRISFRATQRLTWIVIACILLVGGMISYSPVGYGVFRYLFGVQPDRVQSVIQVFRVFMFVSIFSSLRCLYHGVIIFNMRTKWLTFGMLIRLLGMYLVSMYFITTDSVTSGAVGAVIFLVGMMIECTVSYLEGSSLLKKSIPEKKEHHEIENTGHVFRFYKPLLFSSLIAIIAGPSINIVLGKTVNAELAIASFAIASSLTQLVQSFFSYIHQIVLNFYRKDKLLVRRFTLVVAFIPSILIALLSYTPLGPWFMQSVMGVNDRLMHASLDTLRIFMITTLVFPWLDYMNGIIMLRGETRMMMWSQSANVTFGLIVLLICIFASGEWNGVIGSLAQSLGLAAEAAVMLWAVKATSQVEQTMLKRQL
jgi:Na+-driven multidrug efflux pump